MKEFMKFKVERKEHLLGHRFFEWLRSDAVPVSDKLHLAPIMAAFVMNFRDTNRWFLRYPKPRNEFESVINYSTREGETHSGLFLEDWQKLGLDDELDGEPATRSIGSTSPTTPSRSAAWSWTSRG